MTTQRNEKGGTAVPPFFVDDPVRSTYNYLKIGKIIRISTVEPRYLVQWHNKARTTGWYSADELVDAW